MTNAGDNRRVIIHIGLHKTGTRFLQRMVFAQLDKDQFNYNPDDLWPTLRQAMRHPQRDDLADQAREAARQWRSSDDGRNLILSEPHISGDMYGSHHDYPENLALLRELFPEATIVFFVRRQSDWLQSAYRQQLVKDQGVPIEVFLNWYDGDFRPRVGRWAYGVRNIEALSLRFLEIYRAYATEYGPDNVYLFRQEDLRARPDAVKERLAEAMGIDALPSPPRERTQNRSYSALAIHLFHPGVVRTYRRPVEADAWRRASWPRKLTRPLRRFRRTFIQHGFDKLVYRDWDLLAKHGMRERIEAHYADENEAIQRIATTILDEGPHAVALTDDAGERDAELQRNQ